MKLSLKTAQSYADKISIWLSPFCQTIQVAGSIRRRRPEIGDIDLVCIPKVEEEHDLLGNVVRSKNLLRAELIRYLGENPAARWRKGTPQEDAVNLLVTLPKCELDIWCATDQTLATRLLCRTGSMQHNIWIASRAKRLGGHWDSYNFLRLAGRTIYPRSEEELYAALDLPFIAPENRESDFIRHFDACPDLASRISHLA